MSSTEELAALIGARWVREQARQRPKEGTHPVRAAAGPALDLHSILPASFRAPERTGGGVPDGDHHRGRATAAVAGRGEAPDAGRAEPAFGQVQRGRSAA